MYKKRGHKIDRFAIVISSFPVVQTWPFDTLYVSSRTYQSNIFPPQTAALSATITPEISINLLERDPWKCIHNGGLRFAEQSRELFITLDSRESRDSWIFTCYLRERLFYNFIRMQYYSLLITPWILPFKYLDCYSL